MLSNLSIILLAIFVFILNGLIAYGGGLLFNQILLELGWTSNHLSWIPTLFIGAVITKFLNAEVEIKIKK